MFSCEEKAQTLRHDIELLKIQHAVLQDYARERAWQQKPGGFMKRGCALFYKQVVRGDHAQRHHFYTQVAQYMPQFVSKLRQRLQRLGRGGAHDLQAAWRALVGDLPNKDFLTAWSWPENQGKLRLLALGGGGVGDVLQILPVLAALKKKVPDVEICLLHTNPEVEAIMRGNDAIASAACVPLWRFAAIIEAGHRAGAVDVAMTLFYVVQYLRSPALAADKSAQFGVGFFEKAAAVFAQWAAHVPRFPRFNHLLCTQALEEGLHLFEVMGRTANLDVTRDSPIAFIPDPAQKKGGGRAPEGRFVTVHNGAHQFVRAHAKDGRITKMLAPALWEDILARIKNENQVQIVQLGTKDESLLAGVDVDLRGALSLHEAAHVLKKAALHLDTEGGLVHLARAVGCRSLVLFGPTSAPFFGYPGNINLTAGTCANCFWIKDDWYIQCSRGLSAPACMEAFRAADIAALVRQHLDVLTDENVAEKPV